MPQKRTHGTERWPPALPRPSPADTPGCRRRTLVLSESESERSTELVPGPSWRRRRPAFLKAPVPVGRGPLSLASPRTRVHTHTSALHTRVRAHPHVHTQLRAIGGDTTPRLAACVHARSWAHLAA